MFLIRTLELVSLKAGRTTRADRPFCFKNPANGFVGLLVVSSNNVGRTSLRTSNQSPRCPSGPNPSGPATISGARFPKTPAFCLWTFRRAGIAGHHDDQLIPSSLACRNKSKWRGEGDRTCRTTTRTIFDAAFASLTGRRSRRYSGTKKCTPRCRRNATRSRHKTDSRSWCRNMQSLPQLIQDFITQSTFCRLMN